MYGKMRYAFVVMVATASLFLFSIVPAYAHAIIDGKNAIDDVGDLIDEVVHDILDSLQDTDRTNALKSPKSRALLPHHSPHPTRAATANPTDG
jgi:hypothetical protein